VKNPIGNSRFRRTVGVGISTLGLLAAGAVTTVGTATSAHAAACVSGTAWTSYDPSSSDSFPTPTDSACNDFNAAYTFSIKDGVRGWYYSNSSGWQAGSRGFVTVTTVDSGWLVLLTSVVNGTRVRGEGQRYSQYVRYVI
jgi:hypothetical protein